MRRIALRQPCSSRGRCAADLRRPALMKPSPAAPGMLTRPTLPLRLWGRVCFPSPCSPALRCCRAATAHQSSAPRLLLSPCPDFLLLEASAPPAELPLPGLPVAPPTVHDSTSLLPPACACLTHRRVASLFLNLKGPSLARENTSHSIIRTEVLWGLLTAVDSPVRRPATLHLVYSLLLLP